MNPVFCKITWLLLALLFILNPAGHTQPQRIFQDLLYTANSLHADASEGSSIRQADSIAHSSGIARHFASTYSLFMKNIAVQLSDADSGTRRFVTKFEAGFMDYFLKACSEYTNGNLSAESDWNCYFSQQDIQEWQMVLLGVNVHVNSDMWRAFVDNFSEKEIRHYKKQFLRLQRSISKGYSPFFDAIASQNGYLKFINSFTKGLAKSVGQWTIYKWRRRSIHLAILFYQNPKKFEKKFDTVKMKKQKIDQIILNK